MNTTDATSLSPVQLSINAIRSLSVDAVQKAKSGHPGLPLGAAATAYVLWTRFLQHNPTDPLTYTEDCAQRFAAYGWHTQSIDDGNDLDAIDRVIHAARQDTGHPSVILVRNTLLRPASLAASHAMRNNFKSADRYPHLTCVDTSSL